MLQQRAIELAGGIGPKTDIPALMEALHIEVKKTEREKKQEQEAALKAAKTGSGGGGGGAGPENGGGAGTGTGSLPIPGSTGNSPPSAPSSRLDKSRSSALRRTPATGGSYSATRGKNGGGGGTGTGTVTGGGGDQWAAWKEIQMQNVQMSQLEDQLTASCTTLGIDALHILVSIDANLSSAMV